MTPLRNNYCVYGKTKVFFRSGAIDHLEKQRHHVRSSLAINIQKWVRMVLSVQKYKKEAREQRIVQHDSIVDNMMLKGNNNRNNNSSNSSNSSGDKNRNTSNISSSNKRRPRRRLSLPSFGYSSSKSSESIDNGDNNDAIVAAVSNSNNKDTSGFITYYNNPSPILDYNNSDYYQYLHTSMPPPPPPSSSYSSKWGEGEQQSSFTHLDDVSTSNYSWNSEANTWQQQKSRQLPQQREQARKPARRRMSLPLWGQQQQPKTQQHQEEQHHEPAHCNKRSYRRLSLSSEQQSFTQHDGTSTSNYFLNSETNVWQQQNPQKQQPQQQEQKQETRKPARRRMSLPLWGQQQQNPQQQQPQQEQEQQIHMPARRRMSLPLWGQQQPKSQQQQPQQEQEQQIHKVACRDRSKQSSGGSNSKRKSRRRLSLPSFGSFSKSSDSNNNDDIDNGKYIDANGFDTQYNNPPPPLGYNENNQYPGEESFTENNVDATTSNYSNSKIKVSQQERTQRQPQKEEEQQTHKLGRRARRRLSRPLSYNNADDGNDDNLGGSERGYFSQKREQSHKPARRRVSLQFWKQPEPEPQLQDQSHRARRHLSQPLSYNKTDDNNGDNLGGSERGYSSQKREQSHKPARRRLSLQCWKQPKPEQQLEPKPETEPAPESDPELETKQQDQSYKPVRHARRRLSLPLSYNNANDSNDDNLGGSERGTLSTIPSSLSGKQKRRSRRRFSLLSPFGSTKGRGDRVLKEEKNDEQQQQTKQRRRNLFSPTRFLRRSTLSSMHSQHKDSYDTGSDLYERQQQNHHQQQQQQQNNNKTRPNSRRRWSLLGSRGGGIETFSPIQPPIPTPSDNQRPVSCPAVLTPAPALPKQPKDVTYYNNNSDVSNDDDEDKYRAQNPPKFENNRNNIVQGHHHQQQEQQTLQSISQHDAVPKSLPSEGSNNDTMRSNSMSSINSISSYDSSSTCSIIDFDDIVEANKEQKVNLIVAAISKEKVLLLPNNTYTTEEQQQPETIQNDASINSIINKKGRGNSMFELPDLDVTDRTLTERFSSTSSVISNNQSTSDELSYVNSSSNQETKRVSFGNIEIRKHPIILGDHPSCRQGVPITIDWKHFEKTEQMIDEYESERMGSRRHKYQLALGPVTRKHILKEETGVSDDKIYYATMGVQRIQQGRMESLNCKELARELKKDRLYSKINDIIGRSDGSGRRTGGTSKWWSGLQQGTSVESRRQQQRKGGRRYSM